MAPLGAPPHLNTTLLLARNAHLAGRAPLSNFCTAARSGARVRGRQREGQASAVPLLEPCACSGAASCHRCRCRAPAHASYTHRELWAQVGQRGHVNWGQPGADTRRRRRQRWPRWRRRRWGAAGRWGGARQGAAAVGTCSTATLRGGRSTEHRPEFGAPGPLPFSQQRTDLGGGERGSALTSRRRMGSSGLGMGATATKYQVRAL